MTAPILAATVLCIGATTIHIVSLIIAAIRLRRNSRAGRPCRDELPSVSLVRPLCGIDNYSRETLASTFALDYRRCEILFCVADAADTVVPLTESMIAQHAEAEARLLIGEDRISANPKLNNVLKGWRTAKHDWIVLADSNLLLPPDYIEQLFANWRDDTGLVASPPIGAEPHGLWAELECAFLNTYQARWQYIADALGCGFAQGKTMLWRRGDLEQAGGIAMLANEVAEDAASTKIVRGAGRKVRLVDRPFPQPLGCRSAREVWHRQLRWARLRRASFFAYFLPEALSGGTLPMLTFALAAPALGLSATFSVIVLAVLWYGAETLLALAVGWHASWRYPLICLARDLLLPALFVGALFGDGFVWRGNAMQVERLRPREVIASVKPRFAEIAPLARRRLRSLRERMS